MSENKTLATNMIQTLISLRKSIIPYGIFHMRGYYHEILVSMRIRLRVGGKRNDRYGLSE